MTRSLDAGFSVSLDQSTAFARLSGDYNPLHLDPVAARRTPFGGTVTHGVHLFLAALNEAASRELLPAREPENLSVTFHAPVPTASTVALRVHRDDGRFVISGQMNARPAFHGTVAFGDETQPPTAIEDAEFEPAQPSEPDFPPSVTHGEVPLRLSRSLLARLFPSLASVGPVGWVADLLASTQVVGMRCPGMNSVYSGFKLRREVSDAGTSMRYRVERTDERFRLARLSVSGSRLAGTLDTFFRPRAVTQKSMRDVAGSVRPNAFEGERALVVGGSRGLGELTAKILAAGAADVVITYARGKADAERVSAEVTSFGGRCSFRHLDVLSDLATGVGWLDGSQFSHVYFFASPPIPKSGAEWDDALFQQFKRAYVDAFEALIERLVAGQSHGPPLRFFYPSSVLVQAPENGFREYAAAKAGGETICDQWEGGGARFMKPRLPRMLTDQTSAITGSGAPDGFPVMLDVIDRFHG